ncbi:MAG: glycosyltransferase family 4 protein [Leptolyngbyaceae cyanobacterium bins.302]|nr:glycosyltransferase family 4 protein [Leptolyngbyaceae cyanobacterium bins.302]
MVLWLRERFKWMGAHSGYDELFATIAAVQPGNYASAWRDPHQPKSKMQKQLLDRIVRGALVSSFYNYDSTAAELSVLWQCFKSRHELVHVAYVETCLGILPRFKASRRFKLVGTVHQPSSWWRLLHPHPKGICDLDALIVLSQSEVRYFEQFLPNQVYCIPHGVDTDFFHPKVDPKPASDYPRCIFSGAWLRDLDTLERVIAQVLAQDPGIQFDMIVPRSNRNQPAFHRLAQYEQVFWHAGISDEQLRDLYQRASCILLPFLNSTANNALLEAIACGLPVVTNQVGGTPDYTHPTFAHLHPVGDIDSMTASVLQVVGNQQQQQLMGVKARAFAEQHFRWDYIAKKTLEVYSQLLSNTGA